MSLDIIEQILEMLHKESLLGQNYFEKGLTVKSGRIHIQCEKKEPIYCCPQCKQQTFSGYDSNRRLIEDLSMSGKRVFINLPIYRLYCSFCKSVVTEYLPFLEPFSASYESIENLHSSSMLYIYR